MAKIPNLEHVAHPLPPFAGHFHLQLPFQSLLVARGYRVERCLLPVLLVFVPEGPLCLGLRLGLG